MIILDSGLLFVSPCIRLQYECTFQDLVNCTPTSHADYDPLQKTLIITQQFLENLDEESSNGEPSVMVFHIIHHVVV